MERSRRPRGNDDVLELVAVRATERTVRHGDSRDEFLERKRVAADRERSQGFDRERCAAGLDVSPRERVAVIERERVAIRRIRTDEPACVERAIDGE